MNFLQEPQRLQFQIQGAVQGVGFRPFVYRLAQTLGLAGWICNTPQGVCIEVEGTIELLTEFQVRLAAEKPAHAVLQRIDRSWIAAIGAVGFEIRKSQDGGEHPPSALILPDLATCPACLADIFNPNDRHYRYPFTNCTYCGPRFSILRSLPYDRANTTLHSFPLCADCQAEYDNPADRRFHAQPNACPRCGPHIALWSKAGEPFATQDRVWEPAAQLLREGQILAVKGLGGFHLMVDARNEDAVQTLRHRKHRPHKPFAVMFPSLAQVQAHCQVDSFTAELLQTAAAPIVLLRRSSGFGLAPTIAPENPFVGAMLPYTPLHHLLLAAVGFPLVATSGNRSGEPLCIDEGDARETLGEIADYFLVHDRPIARPVDDSIVQIVGQTARLLRRARGYAPFPISLPGEAPAASEVILAVGGHLKNTVALYAPPPSAPLSLPPQIVVSPHLGDLDSVASRDRFREAINHLCGLYHTNPTIVVGDAHPDYYSSQFAQQLTESPGLKDNSSPAPRRLSVQHHYAHVLSALADQGQMPPVLGIAWDGTGYGLDGTIWGGEFLWIPAEPLAEPGFSRIAHLKTFPLPGGEKAVKEPRRAALGLLYAALGESATTRTDLAPLQTFSSQELGVLHTMLRRGLNSPQTSSIGRFLDAIASLLGLCHRASFEGQAAMALEFTIAPESGETLYPYQIERSTFPWQLDWTPMLFRILDDLVQGVSPHIIAAIVHNTLIAGLVDIAQAFRSVQPNCQRIVLTGGCFQNRYLLQRAIDRLQKCDFLVEGHQHLPSNDGSLAVGQIVAALRFLQYQEFNKKLCV